MDRKPAAVAGNIDLAYELASDRRVLNGWLIARLVQIAAGAGGSAGVRAIDMLLGLPIQEGLDEDLDEVDVIAERYAVRLLRGKGYSVRRGEEEGSD